MAARRATIDTSNLARMVESPAVGVDSTLSAGKLSHMLGDGMDISEHPQRRRETIDCSGLGTLQGLMDEVADEEPPAAAAARSAPPPPPPRADVASSEAAELRQQLEQMRRQLADETQRADEAEVALSRKGARLSAAERDVEALRQKLVASDASAERAAASHKSELAVRDARIDELDKVKMTKQIYAKIQKLRDDHAAALSELAELKRGQPVGAAPAEATPLAAVAPCNHPAALTDDKENGRPAAHAPPPSKAPLPGAVPVFPTAGIRDDGPGDCRAS